MKIYYQILYLLKLDIISAWKQGKFKFHLHDHDTTIWVYKPNYSKKDLRTQKRLSKFYRKKERKYLSYFDRHFPRILEIFFGVPGSGKTTMAAAIAKKAITHGIPVYSNVPITGALKIEPQEDIGNYLIRDGVLIIDESSIEYNSRKFKSFSDEARYFYKYHRHYNTYVCMFSQGYDDMDKVIRTLAQNLYVIRKSFIPYHIFIRRISKKIGIDENTKQIIDVYSFPFLGWRWIFAPLYWKMFNTISRKPLPSHPLDEKGNRIHENLERMEVYSYGFEYW